jgi:hypothetical protein
VKACISGSTRQDTAHATVSASTLAAAAATLSAVAVAADSSLNHHLRHPHTSCCCCFWCCCSHLKCPQSSLSVFAAFSTQRLPAERPPPGPTLLACTGFDVLLLLLLLAPWLASDATAGGPAGDAMDCCCCCCCCGWAPGVWLHKRQCPHITSADACATLTHKQTGFRYITSCLRWGTACIMLA